MFDHIKKQVQKQFAKLAKEELFIVDVEKNELFNAYLDCFQDPVIRQEHNCNCCKSFLNHYGHIVAIKNGKLSTLWEFTTVDPYAQVPQVLDQLVKSKPISGVFLSKIDKLGTDYNHEQLENGDIIRWDHFFVNLPADKVIRKHESLESIQGNARSTKQVFARSLETISMDAITTVLDLISQNALYRGKEFEKQLQTFLKHKREYEVTTNKNLFIWSNYKEGGRIRNTAIGTLLINLSEGMELDSAVSQFENIVAPYNYKRPTALVTATMVKNAEETIRNLGLSDSLRRRHATADDIPITNLLFVNQDHKNKSVFDEIKSEVPVNPKSFAHAKEIKLDDFITTVLPNTTTLDVLLENNHNFMSLIAPMDKESSGLFSWDNPVSWTYQNNLTDAIREKVKKAGGNVTGELRISLEWFNFDDLDLHVHEPGGGHIYFSHKRSNYSCGYLDVDMNARGGTTREPVENIIYPNAGKTREGTYKVVVHNFHKRENTDLGFNIQIECQGKTIDLSYSKAVASNEYVEVATFEYSHTEGLTNFKSNLTNSVSHKEVNGVLTNRFQKVNMLMFSPNHWTNDIGNKHLFFIIDKVQIDDPLRPFFNEFIRPQLQEHRKVFEILGSKLMIQPTRDQLSGIGFSLTQPTTVIVRANNTVYKVVI